MGIRHTGCGGIVRMKRQALTLALQMAIISGCAAVGVVTGALVLDRANVAIVRQVGMEDETTQWQVDCYRLAGKVLDTDEDSVEYARAVEAVSDKGCWP